MPRVAKTCQELQRVNKVCQELPEITKRYVIIESRSTARKPYSALKFKDLLYELDEILKDENEKDNKSEDRKSLP